MFGFYSILYLMLPYVFNIPQMGMLDFSISTEWINFMHRLLPLQVPYCETWFRCQKLGGNGELVTLLHQTL